VSFLDSYQELELVVDKMVEEFNRLRKENEQLWKQVEAEQRKSEESELRIRELELRLESESRTISSLIKRVRGSLVEDSKKA
jgi:predicted RNase H-like nuclease (RuvC/YqgF family)